MADTYQIRWSPVPGRALIISAFALAVPVVVAWYMPAYNYELLVWLLALVPAFLLAYYRGWRGVAVAMATGMALISTAQVVLEVMDRSMSDPPLFLGILVVYIGVGLGLGWLSELLHRERAKSDWLALTDEMTGLPNRRQAMFFLDKEFAAARRGRPLAVVFFDLDGLKRINDTDGHRAGDVAICALAEALHVETRDMELSARIGGDEFMSVLEVSTGPGATRFVDRVRDHLGSMNLEFTPSFSAGVAVYSDVLSNPQRLIELADAAMYSAKGSGTTVVAHLASQENGTG